VSRHPIDRLALIVGLPIFVLGVFGMADDTGLVDDNAWVWVVTLVLVGVTGIFFAVRSEIARR
jgi:hypothetical protein